MSDEVFDESLFESEEHDPRSVNAASALHNILDKMMHSNAANIQDGWSEILGAQCGTAEFARRHGEVVGLLNQIATRIHGLPKDNRLRIRSLTYYPTWYGAVVFHGPWGSSNHPAQMVIEPGALHQLESLAEHFDTLFGDEERTLSDDSISQLRANLNEWRDLLGDAGLPRGLTNQIRAQVDHVEWLLGNVQMFGTQPVVERVQELVGTGVTAMATKPKLAKRIGAVVVGSVVFLGSVNQGIEEVNGILEGVQEMATHVQSIADGDWNKPETPQLGPADIPTQSEGQIIDVEAEDEAAS